MHIFSTATSWGVSMKVKELIALLLIFQWITVMLIASKVEQWLILNILFLVLALVAMLLVHVMHGKSLIEVKCPYRCHDKSIEEAVNDKVIV